MSFFPSAILLREIYKKFFAIPLFIEEKEEKGR